jgi:ankyrin repeat protein
MRLRPPALLPGLLLLAACDGEPELPARKQVHTSGGRNLAMGTGEGRDPQPFTLEQRLLDGVRRGDRPTIERALELGAPIGSRDDLGRSTLLLAARDAGDLELVQMLHARGAVVDEPDVAGRAAVSFAASEGRLDIVRWLVEHGAIADRPDGQHRTPLFHAALTDHADVVTYLLARGAAVNTRDQFGDTPLIVACAKGNVATVEVLLAHGADPALKDQEGRTAKERAAPAAAPCLAAPPPR